MRVNTIEAFFALVRAGLWEKEVNLSEYGKIDYLRLYDLAEEQSVMGLVTSGLEHVTDTKISKQELLQFIGASLQLEEQNKAMNYFIGVLVDKMRTAGIDTLLVKGQGVAQCYERPLWRACGDVDFYLDETNYKKAKAFLRPLVDSIDPDDDYAKHINMHYGTWVVEIHANQYCGLSPRIDRVLDSIHEDLFKNNNVRLWENDETKVKLPAIDDDVLIVFTHYLKHFYKGGLGIRQICDWCRLLWTYRGIIDQGLLETRLCRMGLMSEWKAFVAYSVVYLGAPSDTMPFYDTSKRWIRKAKRINSFILQVGNFGHKRDTPYYGRYPFVIRKAISFGRRCGDLFHHATIFPRESFRFFVGMVLAGFSAMSKGE
jgi:hypothetical protein